MNSKTSLVYMVSSIMGKKRVTTTSNDSTLIKTPSTIKTTIYLEVNVVILRNTLLNKVNP